MFLFCLNYGLDKKKEKEGGKEKKLQNSPSKSCIKIS